MQIIFWDWNGTLLDDLGFCISSINELLEKRNLALITPTMYREVFSFPVKDYYEAIGFDFEREEFAVPAREFIDIYENGVVKCSLQPSAIEILNYYKEKNVRQFILSAMEQNMLEKTLKQNSIFDFFEGVFGLDNHYAASKIERGKQLIEQFNLKQKDIWMVGDTTHDFEVAENLGINCILVAGGHQSGNRLGNTGATVVSNLSDLKAVLR